LGFSDCWVLEVARKTGNLPLGTFDEAPAKQVGTRKKNLQCEFGLDFNLLGKVKLSFAQRGPACTKPLLITELLTLEQQGLDANFS